MIHLTGNSSCYHFSSLILSSILFVKTDGGRLIMGHLEVVYLHVSLWNAETEPK